MCVKNKFTPSSCPPPLRRRLSAKAKVGMSFSATTDRGCLCQFTRKMVDPGGCGEFSGGYLPVWRSSGGLTDLDYFRILVGWGGRKIRCNLRIPGTTGRGGFCERGFRAKIRTVQQSIWPCTEPPCEGLSQRQTCA